MSPDNIHPAGNQAGDGERLQFLLRYIVEAYFVLDSEWRFRELNAAAAELFQRSPGELLGVNIWEAFPQAVGSEFYRQYHAALAQNAPVYFEAQSQSTQRWLEVHANPRHGWLEVYLRDITTRESVAQFPEQNPNPVLRLAQDGAVLYANTAAQRLLAAFGWPAGGPAPEPLLQPALAALRQSVPSSLELPSGALVYAFTLVPFPQAGYTNLYGIDITPRKRLEERLAFEARVLDTVHDAIIAVDTQMAITSWNRGAEALYGFSAAEALGQNVSALLRSKLPPADRQKALRQLEETDFYTTEVLQYTKAGELIVVEGVSIPIRDAQGQVTGYVAANHDITRRKHAEAERERLLEENRRQTELLEKVFLGIPGGIAVLAGDDLVIRMANPAFRALTPNPAVDPVGQPFEEVWPSQTGFPGHDLVRHVLHSGAVVSIDRLSAPYPAGDARSFSFHLQPLAWEGQVAALAVLWEITALDEATQAIARYTAELERSNRELQDFAFIASHDLQEPLRKIQAFSERLQNRHSQALDTEALDYLGRMQTAAGRMQRMIEGLLSYSRVATRQAPFTRVDLGQLVDEVLGDLEVRIEKTGGEVQVGDLPILDADPIQMRLLLQNLIGNALKFHRPGVPPIVQVDARRCSPASMELVISDNGIGFDEQFGDRLFQPFQRLVGRSQYEGTGIGLAICRKIVERHGGQISASGRPGQGATFTITLPLIQEL